jgi:hypothetical protein
MDLLFEIPVPVNPPPDGDFSELLRHRNEAPKSDVESTQAAIAYQKWSQKCATLIGRAKARLERFPGCTLKGEMLELALAASGFDLLIKSAGSHHSHFRQAVIEHLHMSTSASASMNATRQLCAVPGQLSASILHKVLGKKELVVRTGICTVFSEETLSFSEQRKVAQDELSRRGNPPYDPQAYFERV